MIAQTSTYKLVLAAGDVGDIHVVGGGAKLLKLLASEDVNGDQVDLGVTVLASLGGRHVDDLAGTALDDNEAVLPEGRALHREGQRRTGVSRVEGVFMLQKPLSACEAREGERQRQSECVLCGHGREASVCWPSYVGAVRGALLRPPQQHKRRRGSGGLLAYLSVVGHLDEV